MISAYLVSKPVLIAKTICQRGLATGGLRPKEIPILTSLSISWFDFGYFVRDVCSTVTKRVAMATSAVAAKALIQIESPYEMVDIKPSFSSAKVFYDSRCK